MITNTPSVGSGSKIHHRGLMRAQQGCECPGAFVQKALDAQAEGLVTDFR